MLKVIEASILMIIMERGRNLEPDPDYDAHIELIKGAFIRQAKMRDIEIYGSDDIDAITEPLLSELFDGTKEALEAVGIDVDSLDMTAAYLELTEYPRQDDESGEGEGGIGVREPRNPLPGNDAGSISIVPQI